MVDVLPAIIVSTLFTSALFFAPPVIIGVRRDRRLAEAHGVASQPVGRSRFFLPRFGRLSFSETVIGRSVWIEHWTQSGRGKSLGRVVAVADSLLTIAVGDAIEAAPLPVHRLEFRPRAHGAKFAEGRSAATGALLDGGAKIGGALVIFV